MADTDHSNMNEQNYRDHYTSSIAPEQPYTIVEKYLQYYPKLWDENELIETIDMNNIEQGIQIALESRTEMEKVKNQFIGTINSELSRFNERVDQISGELTDFQTQVTNAVGTQLSGQNNDIITTLQQIIGVTDYNIQSLPYSRPEGVKAIDTRITELYNEVFGQGSSGSTSANSLNARLQALTTTVGNLPTDIFTIIGPRLGPAYYSNGSWETTYTNIDSRITQIYNAIFGSSSGGTLNGSLIDKVEKAMGRSLNLEDGEIADDETGAYSNSLSAQINQINQINSTLTAQINQIKGILGMDGGTEGSSSNLAADVTALMRIIYGTTTVEGKEVINDAEIAHTLREIVGSFYDSTISVYDQSNKEITIKTGRLDQLVSSLSSNIATIIQDNTTNTSSINTLNSEVQDLLPAYIDAGSTPIGENNYLILKRVAGKNEQTPASESDLEAAILEGSLHNTYIKLPKGGGGTATSYDYNAQIIDLPITNTSIKIGDTCNLGFTWRVTDIKDEERYIPLSGTLQLLINNSVVLTEVIDSNTSHTLNLGTYITSAGRKNITLTITHNAVPSKSRYYTITAYNANLLVNLNTEQNFSGELINIPYLAAIGSKDIGKTLKVFIDDDTEPVVTNTTYSETNTSITIETPSMGAHLLRIYFTSKVNETLQITSDIYKVGIICRASMQEFIATDLVEGFKIKQYENLNFNYIVGSSLTSIETYNVTITINGKDYFREAQALKQTNFTTLINFAGPLHIILTSANASYEVHGTVTQNADYTFELQGTDNLIFNLPTENRSNQEAANERIKWENDAETNYLNMLAQQKFMKPYNELTAEDKATIIEPTITLSNFLFADGYDGWLQDKNGKNFLRLRNTDQVVIHNFPLFKQNNLSDNITFEIEFKTSEVVNANTIFLNQRYNDDTTSQQDAIRRELAIRAEMQEQGTTDDDYSSETRNYKTYTDLALEELLIVLKEKIIIGLTPQEMTIYNSFISRLRYKEEETTTISYVINGASNNNGDDSQLIYTYINGVLSNIGKYASLIGYNSIGDIIIGSTECTVDIYAFRVYNTNLTSQQIVNNWIYGISDLTERTLAYNRNNYPTVDRNSTNKNIITPTNFELCSPGTPYMIIKAKGDLKDKTAMPQEKGGDLATKVDIEYIDRLNEKNSFTSSNVKIQVQGTSSQFYPRKNYKIKMSSFIQNDIIHKKKLTKEDYVDGNTSGTLKENIVKKGYKLSSSSVPVFDFCLKADYASSEGVNNTGLVALYEKLVQANQAWQSDPQKLQTAAEKEENQIRQGVEGYPIVVFYLDTENHPNDDPIFLGKYNFNNDKGTHDVFGLKTFQKNWYYNTEIDPNENSPILLEDTQYLGDESWEGADNFYPLNVFRPYVNGPDSEILGPEKWAQAFPARFPGAWEDATDTEKNGESAAYSNIPDREALKEVISWVYSTRTEVLKQAADKTWYDAAADPNDPDYVGPDIENNLTREQVLANHLQKFRDEFNNYFNLNIMLLFYCFTEFFLMVDNRAKNVFWTRYITTENRDETALLTAENQTYGKWITLPYDFDTAMGINNQGEYQFDYHYEDGDFLPSGQLVFNGQPSILFTNFRKAFKEEIGVTFTSLFRNAEYAFDYDQVEAFLEKHQSAWSETVYNEDARVKYISEKANYSMAQGSKKETNRWWLSNRFRYMKSKYRYTDDTLFIRANRAGTISVETYADAYVSFRLGTGASATTATEKVLQGQTKTLSVGGTANNSVVNIFPASCLKTVNGISQLLADTIDLSACTKLQNIRIGSALDTPNPNLTTSNFTINENNKILRLLDLRNCNGENLTSLDLSMCASLEKVYLSGTQLSSIGLPNGGILHTIQYPAGITSIKIQNQPYLKNLIIGNALPTDEILESEESLVPVFTGTNDYSNISTLYLDNVGQIDSLAIVKTMINTLNESNPRYLYLDGIDWTMTTAEFLTLAKKILQMKGFNGIQPTSDSAPYLSGILHLTTLPTTQEIEYIGANFSNLKLYYKDINGEDNEYYTVRFYDPYGAIITNKTQYITAGESASFDKNEFFTEEYLLAYNQQRTPGWIWGAATRYNFKDWDTSFTKVKSDLEVRPIMELQYRMDYVLQTADAEDETIHTYIFAGEIINPITPPEFERNYYQYSEEGWTKDPNRIYDSVPDDTRTQITTQQIKAAEPESWYAIYKKEPQTYYINIYTTDVEGNKAGEPLNTKPIEKNVLSGGSYGTTIDESDISPYLPTTNNSVAMYGSSEEGIDDKNRTYRFLSIKPYVPSNTGLPVTGNMDILLTYYHKDDIFTNYFLNKIYSCNLTGISAIPNYAFNHNTNLEKLITEASSIGNYSFINFTQALTGNKRRIFIFENTNVNFGTNCFQYLNNALIIFKGSGQITIDSNCFNQITNCRIVAYKTNNPIKVKSDVYSGFSSFTATGTNNILYVTKTAKGKYPTSTNNNNYFVPNNLITSALTGIVSLEEATADYQALLEEAGINDY